jgi:exo-1,4-beta-D-glucosaminidase
LKAAAQIFNLDATEKFSQETNLDAAPNSSARVLTLPLPGDLSPTYFVRLTLRDAAGRTLSGNFYWLSTKPETLGDPKLDTEWYYRPTRDFADLTALGKLPPAELRVSAESENKGKITRVRLENTGRAPAFFVRLKVTAGAGGEEILPVLWEDNYVSLMPGEQREITARHAPAPLPVVEVEGWNAARQTAPAAKPVQ